jgi:hypothetical protein
MKKLLYIFFFVISTLSATYAHNCHGHAPKKVGDSTLGIYDIKEVDGFKVEVVSKKALIVGTNGFDIKITKASRPIEAKVKVKFFMPEMPGMPYMEYKDRGETKKDGLFYAKINFSMGGTWQYHIKFKTIDKKVYKVKGSVSF